MRDVVLIPSLGRPASDFSLLVDALGEAGYRTLALDPAPDFAGEPTLHDLASEMLLRVDAAGIATAHFVGHAFGQRLCRCITARYPQRVATLTMLCAGGYVQMAPDVSAALQGCFRLDDPPDVHLANVAKAFFAPGNDPSVWRHGWLPRVAEYQSAATARTDPDSWRGAAAAAVLVVQGLDDLAAVPENGRRYVAAHADRATLVEIAHAGHALLPEQPQAVAQAVVDFLSTYSD